MVSIQKERKNFPSKQMHKRLGLSHSVDECFSFKRRKKKHPNLKPKLNSVHWFFFLLSCWRPICTARRKRQDHWPQTNSYNIVIENDSDCFYLVCLCIYIPWMRRHRYAHTRNTHNIHYSFLPCIAFVPVFFLSPHRLIKLQFCILHP